MLTYTRKISFASHFFENMTLLLRAVLGSQQNKWQIQRFHLYPLFQLRQSLSVSTSPNRIVHLLQMTYHYDPKFIVHIWIHSWCWMHYIFSTKFFYNINSYWILFLEKLFNNSTKANILLWCYESQWHEYIYLNSLVSEYFNLLIKC